MQYSAALRWSWMNILTAKRVSYFMERFKSLDAALENISLEMLQEAGLREDSALRAMNRLEEFDADAYATLLKKRGITLISVEDAAYPALLSQIEDRPTFLYARGNLNIAGELCISLVGTREMSDYGKRVVSAFIPPIVSQGIVTVSGLAQGIDAEVAKETIRASGKTIAVLGHGFGTMYPKANERLAEEIIAKEGLILTEFPMDIQPDKFTFPARNRIIAGLSVATIVLEATANSGSLITADLALDYNRDVFAVPGQIFDPNYSGCHQLISRGLAKLVTEAASVLTELGIQQQSSLSLVAFVADSPEEQALWDILTAMPISLDDLLLKAKLDAAKVNGILTMLEIKGAAKNVGEGQWVRL